MIHEGLRLDFGRGVRRCIAMNLAHAELYSTVAAVVTRLNLQLSTTYESDVAFKHDFTILRPRLGWQGVRVKVGSQMRGLVHSNHDL